MEIWQNSWGGYSFVPLLNHTRNRHISRCRRYRRWHSILPFDYPFSLWKAVHEN